MYNLKRKRPPGNFYVTTIAWAEWGEKQRPDLHWNKGKAALRERCLLAKPPTWKKKRPKDLNQGWCWCASVGVRMHSRLAVSPMWPGFKSKGVMESSFMVSESCWGQAIVVGKFFYESLERQETLRGSRIKLWEWIRGCWKGQSCEAFITGSCPQGVGPAQDRQVHCVQQSWKTGAV